MGPENEQRAPVSTLEVTAVKMDVALRSGDMQEFIRQLALTIRAVGGYASAAAAAGINRTSLYKSVSSTGNPSLSTIVPLLAHLGLRLSVQSREPLESDVARMRLSLRAENQPSDSHAVDERSGMASLHTPRGKWPGLQS
jgi:probable addiction module antidote protein